MDLLYASMIKQNNFWLHSRQIYSFFCANIKHFMHMVWNSFWSFVQINDHNIFKLMTNKELIYISTN